MKVDFAHPSNAQVLAYLRNPYDVITGPKAGVFRAAREQDLAAGRLLQDQAPDSINRLNLGTHPDLVERFWTTLTLLVPEPCQWVVYGGPVLCHPANGVIFGWAGGSTNYALRLPQPQREQALQAGAKTVSRYSTKDELDVTHIGLEWVLGNFNASEDALCLQAYQYAGTLRAT